jgi:hypothetical protein
MRTCSVFGGHRFTVVTSYQYLPSSFYSPGVIPPVVWGGGAYIPTTSVARWGGTYFPFTSVRCMYCGATKRDG